MKNNYIKKGFCTKDNSYYAGSEIYNIEDKKPECNNMKCSECYYFCSI